MQQTHVGGGKVGCGRHGPPGPGLRLSPALGSHAARTALSTRVPHFSREEELLCVAVLGFGLALRLVGLGRRSFVRAVSAAAVAAEPGSLLSPRLE